MSDLIYIILHDSMHNIPIYGDVFGATTLALPPQESYFHMHLAVSTENTLSLSTKEEPCNDDNNSKTLCDCVEENFQETERCVLSWHDQSNLVGTNITCSQTNLKHYREYMEGLIDDASFEELHRITGCVPNCKHAVRSNCTLFKKSLLCPW